LYPSECRPTVLVVDDDRDVLEALACYLAAVGLNVATSMSGEDAIAMARAIPLDAIVLDLAMPVVDGFGVIDALQQGKTSQIPIVIFTGLPLATVCRGRQFACVQKPCDPADLMSVVVKAIAARPDAV
jgi:CheY-like chemotaxis protein